MLQRYSYPSKHVYLVGRRHQKFFLMISNISLMQLRVTSLKQTNHDMVSHIAKAMATVKVKDF